jgi:hypothetical protein
MDQWLRWKALNNEATLYGKPMSSSGAIIRAAAAIAELEAELAALKARTCLTCKHMPHTADEQCGQMVGWHMVSEEWGIRNRILTACSEWKKRP